MNDEQKDALLDNDFATSTFWGRKSMTEKELMDKLENDYSISRKLNTHGYLISKEFSFITRATFDSAMISELDYKYHGEKTQKQKEQSMKMLKIVEDFINSYDPPNPVHIVFASRNDSDCALYDANRFEDDGIKRKLIEAFR